MLYYLGKGTEFKKEDCKEYKTIEGALKAAAKNEELVVWDENGNVIGSLTDNVPEGALETNPDGSVNTYNADGNKVGTMTAEELKAATTITDEKDAEGQQGDAGASTDDENGGTGGNAPVEPENGQNGANSEQENGQQTSGDGDDAAGQETSGDDERKTEEQVSDSDTIYPEKTTRAIVDCDGALNLRRSASWGNESICGRAVRGQSYYINHQYSKKVKTMTWKDERYTDAESLKEDAEAKLDELSKPYRSYTAEIINLVEAVQDEEKKEQYKEVFSIALGDTVLLISKSTGIRESHRIVKFYEYPLTKEKNKVELANTRLSFEEVQRTEQELS